MWNHKSFGFISWVVERELLKAWRVHEKWRLKGCTFFLNEDVPGSKIKQELITRHPWPHLHDFVMQLERRHFKSENHAHPSYQAPAESTFGRSECSKPIGFLLVVTKQAKRLQWSALQNHRRRRRREKLKAIASLAAAKEIIWLLFYHSQMAFSHKKRAKNCTEGFTRWERCFRFTLNCLWRELS